MSLQEEVSILKHLSYVFLYTFLCVCVCVCVTKLNSVAISCVKSAFQKGLAKQKQKQKKQKTSIKAVTVHDITEMNCIWAVVTTARIQLKAD